MVNQRFFIHSLFQILKIIRRQLNVQSLVDESSDFLNDVNLITQIGIM